MIKISIDRNREGSIISFKIKGHAEAGKPGKDIVCAAVSGIAYTAVGALYEMLGLRNYTDKNGYMKCSVPIDCEEDKRLKAQVILEAMVIGLKQVENSYRKYVSIVDEEVQSND